MKHTEMLLGVTLRHCSEPVPLSFSPPSLMEVLVADADLKDPVPFIAMCFVFPQEMEQSMNMLNSNHELPDVFSEFMTRPFFKVIWQI